MGKQERTWPFRLKRNGVVYMEDGMSLILMVFNGLNGSSEGSVRAQAAYQGVIGNTLGGALARGDVIAVEHMGITVASYTVGTPIGPRVTEECVFRAWLAKVAESGMSIHQRSSQELLARFRAGVTPDEVQMEAGVPAK